MSRPEIRVYTSETEFVDRPMNDDEYALHLEDKAKAEAEANELAAKAAARLAILERLGLTEDEAKLLLSNA